MIDKATVIPTFTFKRKGTTIFSGEIVLFFYILDAINENQPRGKDVPFLKTVSTSFDAVHYEKIPIKINLK